MTAEIPTTAAGTISVDRPTPPVMGTPWTPSATRVALLGSGEIGKEVAIALMRLGAEVTAIDRYDGAPAQQVAHNALTVDMSDADALGAAVVSTGAELVDPGAAPPTGSIPDSNSVLLAGLVVEHGAALASVSRSADTAASLAGALTAAAASADLIVTSGGVSAGAFDPLTMLAEDRAALDQDRAAGAAIRLRFARVAMQPGKPQGHGTVRADDGREVPLIMLPGNPVSVLVSFRTIVAPALARLMGHDGVGGTGGASGSGGGPGAGPLPRAGARPPVRARAAEAWKTAGGRQQYIPVRFVPAPAGAAAPGAATAETVPQPSDGAVGPAYWVAPTHRLGSGSHLVASLPAAQALAVVAAGTPAVGVGDEVRLIALSHPAGPGGGELPPPPAAAH